MRTITTTTQDGITFTGQLFEPPQSTGISGLILHIHGMAGDIYIDPFYPAMQTYYPEHGWAFLAAEHRGTHSITQFNTTKGIKNIGNAYELFEDCVIDIQAWIKKAQSLGYEKIWLQGHSLGTSKIIYYMNAFINNPIKGLILLSPSDMIGLTQDPEGEKDHVLCIKEARKLAKTNQGHQLLSNNLWGCMRLSANTYINFFESNSNTAIFNYANEALGWNKVANITVPVIAFTGTQDDGIVPVMDPYQAMSLLEEKLAKCPRKKTIVFDNAEHNFKGFENQIVEEVMKFVS